MNIAFLMGLVTTLTQAAGKPELARDVAEFVTALNRMMASQQRTEDMLHDIAHRLDRAGFPRSGDDTSGGYPTLDIGTLPPHAGGPAAENGAAHDGRGIR